LATSARRGSTDTVVTLSERESRNFLAALDEPFSPNPSLKKAMEGASCLMRHSGM
jgi:uncharacterized protein (DUF1778 family)